MGDLFGLLGQRVEANARRAVEAYTREMTEYKSVTADRRTRSEVLDFAVLMRRRTIELARDDRPLVREDLATFAAIGQQRAELRMSMLSQQQVIGLHTTLTMGEIHEVATPNDTDDLLRLVAWFGRQFDRGRTAYLQGYIAGLGRVESMAAQVDLLARMLLADEQVDHDLAGRVGIRLPRSYLVSVVRIPGSPVPSLEARAGVVEKLLGRCRTPMAWLEPDEFVLLTHGNSDDPAAPPDPGRVRALDLVRDVVAAVGQACSTGTAAGSSGALAEALTSARRISQVAPKETIPRQLYTIDDMFVELGVAQAPWIEKWLRAFIARLKSGPELIGTLDAYYRNDMNRMSSAMALGIHPRTLDYRLRRVRELTGVDPGSSRGVRIFTAGVARALAED